MKSRSARLALLVLFVMALGVTAYLFKKGETARRAEGAASDTFNAKTRVVSRGILELRAAQQAYVATGQIDEFWSARVASTLTTVRDGLSALRAGAVAADALTNLDTAAASLQDFTQMDARAREYVRTGQKVTAADMIFSNGVELTETAVGAVEKANAAELEARAALTGTFERRQDFALAAAAAAAGLVILLLLPRVEGDLPAPSFLEPSAPTLPLPLKRIDRPAPNAHESWSSARPAIEVRSEAPAIPAIAAAVEESAPAAAAIAPDALAVFEAPASAAPVVAAILPTFNFKGIAELCTELSRVDDTMALSPLLERAAELLNAAGIILWIADPDGRELNPVLSQGYPQHLVNRLGTILRGAENATAAAFRTGQLQTVYSDNGSNGAIAAPLLTCGGCVGVMAAEVRGDTEKIEANLAAATILAAQLASLVGPPTVRTDASVEAANA